MAEAGKAFADFLKNIPFNEPKIPVISNVTGRPHEDDIRARMAEQITAPVKWCESIRYLLAQGLRFDDFHEIGAGGAPVLKPMIKRIESEAGPLDATAPAASINQATRKAAYPRTALPGSRAFCETFGVQHPCLAGAMYQGIASVPLVTRMARAGMLAFFGAGGLGMREVEDSIIAIRAATAEHAPFGVNFISHLNRPQLEDELTDILLKFNVRCIEASAFMEVSPALVRYRAHGLRSEGEKIRADNRVIAKLSHPDVAARFLASAPEAIIIALLEKRAISSDQAELLRHVPMCDAVCVESDSGGHTDQGMPFVLIPAMLRLRDAQAERFPRFANIHVGAGGGIGTPEAAAAVFMLGAEFIVTGSVNQCTVEARTSDAVKDMLETMSVRDTAYAPSPEMFELGSKVQVFKKGLFFPARAEKLLGLYRQHDSLDAIDSATRAQIEERFFRASFESVYDELRTRYSPSEIGKAETMPKHKMALVFRRYFRDSTRWALDGVADRKVDFQIHCGPALGAFNQWMAGSAMQSWRNRHADEIALHLLEETAGLLSRRFALLTGNAA